jgi:hypothetical protein
MHSRFVALLPQHQHNARQAWTAAALALGKKPPSPEVADAAASRALRSVKVQAALDAQQAALAVRADYDATRWLLDTLDDIEAARADKSHSAVMKGRELLGRRLGLFQDARSIDPREAALFAQLGAAMQAAYGSAGARVHAREAVELEARLVE